jgi:amidase
MDAAELMYAGPTEQAALRSRGEVTAGDLVEASLERIAALDGRLNAFVETYEDEAREAALAADRRGPDPERPWAGIPLALKDQHDLAGRVTGWGTVANATPAPHDDPVVRRLRESGAIIVGKTRLPELAIYGFTESQHSGPTRNPWDTSRTCGGSSGGSAVAVASGMVGLATASDGAGSIRIPAACCGLFGYKPSSGRTRGSGGWGGLSVNGSVTRTVRDAVAYADLLAEPGIDHLQRVLDESDQPRLRIGVSTAAMVTGPAAPVDEVVMVAVADTADVLAGLGHAVRPVRLKLLAASNQLSARYLHAIKESAAACVEHPGALERRTRQIVSLGKLVPHALEVRARVAGERDSGPLSRLFDPATGVDVLLTPVLNTLPLPIGTWADSSGLATLLGMSRAYGFTAIWNHLGRPAASVPAGLSASGLPLAVQLIGRRGADADVIRLSCQLERARPWAARRPDAATAR